jgi:hypothetical protein
MYDLSKPRYRFVWAEMREILWLFSATALLSVGAAGLGATLALLWGGV